MSLKRALGLDALDILIHVGITFALAVIAASAAQQNEEVGISLVVALSLGVLAWRRTRARQVSPLTTGEVQSERLAMLEERLAELEAERGRVLELEERLDFAERLLARQRESARLAGEEQRP
jgi:hypothetical protein